MREELLKLYKEYCDYIDEDYLHTTRHEYFKESFGEFMYWLENGFVNY